MKNVTINDIIEINKNIAKKFTMIEIITTNNHFVNQKNNQFEQRENDETIMTNDELNDLTKNKNLIIASFKYNDEKKLKRKTKKKTRRHKRKNKKKRHKKKRNDTKKRRKKRKKKDDDNKN